MHLKNFVWILFTACLFLVVSNAQAIPAFARKTNLACSSCHTAWPMLNAFGRQYKELGYRVAIKETPNKTISTALKWDESLPVSTVLVGRPYDKKNSGDAKNRALHEVELMVAGPMGEKFSGFFEIEAEDEAMNDIGFAAGIPTAAFTYNHNEALNVQLSWGANTWFDPYNSYSNGRRMTRGVNSVIDQKFGGADNSGKLRTARQNVALYGRPASNVFYGLALSGDANDAEGVEGSTVTARLAIDVMPALTVGALFVNGTCVAANCGVDRDYQRSGLDMQAEVSNTVINAAFVQATDDNGTATAELKNNAFYIQALYTVMDGGRASWAPLLRYDVYEKMDGAEEISEISLGLNYYFTENVRGMFEFWDRSGDGATADDDRFTVQVFAAF
jgi:Phosphate-selective porin O and P